MVNVICTEIVQELYKMPYRIQLCQDSKGFFWSVDVYKRDCESRSQALSQLFTERNKAEQYLNRLKEDLKQ